VAGAQVDPGSHGVTCDLPSIFVQEVRVLGNNSYYLTFIKTYSAEAQTLAQVTGVNADFILAWTAMESGWGVGLVGDQIQSKVAQANDNFLGLTTQDWVGANAAYCAPGASLGYACFNLWALGTQGSLSIVPSVWSALHSGGGRYLNAILQAQAQPGATTASVATALANAGFNSVDEDNGVIYGNKVAGSDTVIQARKNCPQ